MKFRFTLTHRGSQAEPIAIPALTLWSTQTGADEEWSEGPVPFVNLPGAGAFSPATSEWLYVDFGFEIGLEYSITLEHTTVYNSGTSNPRTTTLAILDNSFVEQFSQVDTFPISPGGTETISLSFTANATSTKIGFKVSSGSDVDVIVNEVSGTGTDPADITESLQISEPDGWKEAVMKLARDKDFHSLIELFDGSFIFYGDNGVVNGGLHFIEYYEITRGFDANLEILIEIAPDDETYETCFEGQLDLSLGERLPKNKFRIPIIRDNFWAKFNSRLKTPVDLQAAVDLDGNPITPVDPAVIALTCQKIQKKYVGEIANQSLFGNAWIAGSEWNVGEFVQIDMDTETLNEIKVKYHLPTASNPEIPVGLFFFEEGGSYEFDIRLEASAMNNLGEQYSLIGFLTMFVKIGNDTPIPFSEADFGPALAESTVFTFTDTLDIPANSNITIYGEITADISVHGGSTFFMIWPSDFALTPSGAGKSEGDLRATHLYITGQTIFPENNAQGLLIHDAGAAIVKGYGLGFSNPFYSELLGSTLTNARQYEQDGCAWRYLVLRGLQVRGYTLSEKPFSMSFEQWWKGIDPILCLGLEYHQVDGGTITPEVSVIQDLSDWDDAGGPFPGGWNYAAFSFPFTSVNGDGGVEGYTCGLWATTGDVTYVVTTVVEIFETGTNPTNITFIWAILDAGFNEIVTEEFTYTSDGFKREIFNITPSSDGTYFAVRIINDTVSDTKSLIIRMAKGETVVQLLTNPDFTSQSPWTNEGSGTDWTFSSDKALVSLTTGSSKELTQAFAGQGVGDYHFIGEYTVSNVGGGEQISITINFLDSGDNVIETKTDNEFASNVKPWNHEFTSIVEIVKIQVIVSVVAGSNMDFETPYASLHLVVTTDPIVTEDEQVIRVEEREFFYQEEMSVLISNIEEISRKYDTEKIYNKIEIGYNQWQAEEISGIDDPQTKHTYSDRLQKSGVGITAFSDFIGASLAIESTRRSTIEKSEDHKFDNNTFIIAINPDDVSPDSYVPELDENFSDVMNLLNSDTRYNIRISVARNFLRWRKWFNGCLQSYLTSFYRFVSGEGNFDMVSTIDQSPDCLGEDNEGQPLSEKQDIDVTDTIIHTPFYYEFEVPMEWETYKTIRENRRNAIGISLTESGHVPMFIDQLDYAVMEGKAKVTGWTREYLALDVVEGNAATQECMPSTECDNPITDEFGEELTTETGVCITA